MDICVLLQPGGNTYNDDVHAILEESQAIQVLSKACKQLCTKEFQDLFKTELGCLTDYESEVTFKSDTKPLFCKPQTVPLAILEDHNTAYNAGI